MWSLPLALLHLLCLPLGVFALAMRASSLTQMQGNRGLKRLLVWDNIYGVTAVLWIGSGLVRAFGGTDKGTDYYLGNHVFWTKMLLLVALLAVELKPMVTFFRWRFLPKETALTITEPQRSSLLRLHHVELALIIGMVMAAGVMARGFGSGSKKSIERGSAVYLSECAHCHQADGRGEAGRVAPDFVGNPAWLAKSDRVLLKSIEEGVPGTAMLAFGSRLTERERRDALAFIRARFGTRK